MEENKKNDELFYRERSWQMLLDEIKAIREDVNHRLEAMEQRIFKLERKMYWFIGMGASLVFIIDYVFRYLNK